MKTTSPLLKQSQDKGEMVIWGGIGCYGKIKITAFIRKI